MTQSDSRRGGADLHPYLADLAAFDGQADRRTGEMSVKREDVTGC